MKTTIFAAQKVVNYENGNRVALTSTLITNKFDSLYENASEVSPMVI